MYKITITQQEAMLADWVLTMHNWDPDVLARLTTRYNPIRYEVAKVLMGQTDSVELEEGEEFDEFIAMIPVIFSVDGHNVGLSLKTKLYKAKFGGGIDAETFLTHDQAGNKTEADGGAQS